MAFLPKLFKVKPKSIKKSTSAASDSGSASIASPAGTDTPLTPSTPLPAPTNTPSSPILSFVPAPAAYTTTDQQSEPQPSVQPSVEPTTIPTDDAHISPMEDAPSPDFQPTSEPEAIASSEVSAQSYEGSQTFYGLFSSTNVSYTPGETAQTIDGNQQFYNEVVNNNTLTSDSNKVGEDNDNCIITGDVVEYYEADPSGTGTQRLLISQRTTSNDTLPATAAASSASTTKTNLKASTPSALQVIEGNQTFHEAVSNNNTIHGVSGQGQKIKGAQVYHGPVTNNNVIERNSNKRNTGNKNSTITGNTVRYMGCSPGQIPGAAIGYFPVMANQPRAPETRFLTNHSGEGAFPLPGNNMNADILNLLNKKLATGQIDLMQIQQMATMLSMAAGQRVQ